MVCLSPNEDWSSQGHALAIPKPEMPHETKHFNRKKNCKMDDKKKLGFVFLKISLSVDVQKMNFWAWASIANRIPG